MAMYFVCTKCKKQLSALTVPDDTPSEVLKERITRHCPDCGGIAKWMKEEPIKSLPNNTSEEPSAAELNARVRDLYRRSDFWSKEAKRLYPILGIFRRSVDWPKTILALNREFQEFENKKRCLFDVTGEIFSQYLGRLVAALKLHGHLTTDEARHLRQWLYNFSDNSSICVPKKPYAQALLLKACLQLGQMRRPYGESDQSLTSVAEDPRTIPNLLSFPVDQVLPPKLHIDTRSLFLTREHVALWARWGVTADYHLAVGYRRVMWEYCNAVRELSEEYLSMDDAFQSLQAKANRSTVENVFLEHYDRIKPR